MMATYPMAAAAAAAAAAGGPCLPSTAFCNLPWMCPGQPPPERLLQPSIPRRDGRMDENLVPGTSHQLLALHNPSVGPSPYFPLDSPSLMYSYYLGFGNADVRRKNATRESTSTLKAWLYEHRKNPYPTKGEKIMLAIITKMTLTQVSTWFANARRRLKKENKGEWGLKDTNDPDEDDFEDDSGQPQNTSASDASSVRGSPDLPRLHTPSNGDPVPPRTLTSPGISTSPKFVVTTTEDAKTSENSDLGDRIPMFLTKSPDRNTHPSPPASSSPASIHHPTTHPTTTSASATPNDDQQVRPPPSEATASDSATSSRPPPAKRKLWSIDDIVSPSPPSESRSTESQGFKPSPTFPLHRTCAPPMDPNSLPYKYNGYFVDGPRFDPPRSSLFPWTTSTTSCRRFEFDPEVRRSHEATPTEFKISNHNEIFARPPNLNVSRFTSQPGQEYSAKIFQTDIRDFKTEDACQKSS